MSEPDLAGVTYVNTRLVQYHRACGCKVIGVNRALPGAVGRFYLISSAHGCDLVNCQAESSRQRAWLDICFLDSLLFSASTLQPWILRHPPRGREYPPSSLGIDSVSARRTREGLCTRRIKVYGALVEE